MQPAAFPVKCTTNPLYSQLLPRPPSALCMPGQSMAIIQGWPKSITLCIWHRVSLLGSQCLLQFLSRSLLHSSGQMGSFYRDRLSSAPVLTPVHLADHLHIGRGSAQCTFGLQLHSSVAVTQRLASCGKAYSSFCVGSYCCCVCSSKLAWCLQTLLET